MRQALDVDNKQIDFIPYVSAHHSMMHVLPSIALGVGTCWANCYDNNSYVLETDDLLSVTWNFDLERWNPNIKLRGYPKLPTKKY